VCVCVCVCVSPVIVDGDFLTVKQLISDGVLGDVKWIECAYNKPFSTKVPQF